MSRIGKKNTLHRQLRMVSKNKGAAFSRKEGLWKK